MKITLQQSNHLKAIAILMMLCLHLFNRDYTNLFQPLLFIGKQPLSYYISIFSDACVPIFAFVSGYGLFYKFQNDKTTYLKGNIARIKKLYINYWIVLVVFAVALGLILNKDGYPGSYQTFLLNISGVNPSYNGAWWFFTTYILFVITSKFWFTIINKIHPLVYLGILLIIYLVAFYFRVYQTNLFSNSILNYLQTQTALYFCTLFQFMLGAFVLKWNISGKIQNKLNNLKFKNLIGFFLIAGLIIMHGIIPNFIVAPFTGLFFILIYSQLDLPNYVNKSLDFLTPHATNMWLIHMFFYMIYFPEFIYSFKYPLVIYSVLVILCILSSSIVNIIYNKIIKWV